MANTKPYYPRITDRAKERWDAFRVQLGTENKKQWRLPAAHLFHARYIDNRNDSLKSLGWWAYEGHDYEPRRNLTTVMLTNQQVYDVLQLAIEHDIRPMRMGRNHDSVTYFLGQFLDAVILDRLMPKNPAEHWTNWQRYRKAPSGVKGPLMPRTTTNEKAHIIACYYSDNHGFTVFELSNGRKVSYGKLKPKQLDELFGAPAAKKRVPIYPNNMDSRPAIDSMLRAEYGESKLPLPPD